MESLFTKAERKAAKKSYLSDKDRAPKKHNADRDHLIAHLAGQKIPNWNLTLIIA